MTLIVTIQPECNFCGIVYPSVIECTFNDDVVKTFRYHMNMEGWTIPDFEYDMCPKCSKSHAKG
jgi:hypothetical protein